MRIAAIQLRVDDAEPPASRIDRALALVSAQRGADLVVLPELWLPGAFAASKYRACAAPLPGEVVEALAQRARELSAHVLAGTFVEQAGDALYNTAVLLSPQGVIVHTYRKLHLFGFDTGEALVFSPGEDASTYAMPGLTTMAMTTCYDLRFPELYRRFVDDGAELFVIPTGWPTARLDHWQLLTRARAVENQVYLIGCNQVGNQEGIELAGHSVVVDPWGRVVAEAGADEEVLALDIDLASVAKTRAAFPILADRRLGLPAPTRRDRRNGGNSPQSV
jgi:predicted amidohydrolase